MCQYTTFYSHATENQAAVLFFFLCSPHGGNNHEGSHKGRLLVLFADSQAILSACFNLKSEILRMFWEFFFFGVCFATIGIFRYSSYSSVFLVGPFTSDLCG